MSKRFTPRQLTTLLRFLQETRDGIVAGIEYPGQGSIHDELKKKAVADSAAYTETINFVAAHLAEDKEDQGMSEETLRGFLDKSKVGSPTYDPSAKQAHDLNTRQLDAILDLLSERYKD